VTEPEAGGAAAKRTGVVFLNTGSNHHVGPNRMYVPLMRALAERGFASLRFDIEGIAESSPRPGARNNDVYTTLAVSNVEAAMAELRARRGVDRIFLVGLCSGAYHAFHTGLHDRSVTGAILINPQTFSWKEGDALDVQRWENYNSSRYYQRRLYNPEVWKKALRLEIDRRHVFDMVRTMSERGAVVVKQKAAALLSRIRGDARGEANLVASFKTILDRGTQVFLVYCKDDAGIDYLDQHVGERRLSSMRKKYPHFRMDIIDGPDHTFTPIWSQERLAEILTAYLTERRG
jgi:pimeloyl-ACP methyl ester carboxylesterase